MILKKKHVNVTTLMGGLRFLEIILLNQLLHIYILHLCHGVVHVR